MYYFLLSFLMILSQVCAADRLAFDPETLKNPQWDENVGCSYVVKWMQEGEVVYTCPMRDFLTRKNKTARFNNEVHYGIIKYDGNYVAVVFKPKINDQISAIYAEKIAFDIYENLIAPHTGHHFIPPTIVREFPDG